MGHPNILEYSRELLNSLATLSSSLQYSLVPLGSLMTILINLEYSGIHLESLMGLPHTLRELYVSLMDIPSTLEYTLGY